MLGHAKPDTTQVYTQVSICKRGQFPPPMKLGGGNPWRSEEVAEAIDALRHGLPELVTVG
jgi:hypothetical protein